MITVRLLGGVKKIIGEDSICISEPLVKMSYVMELLRKNADEPAKLNFDNIIIAVNGVDCSILGGKDASAKEGDEVTVVSIVHGGDGSIR
ncbi:MAG: MoaD/ThiS family protein [Nitrososphaeraceae archaeon]